MTTMRAAFIRKYGKTTSSNWASCRGPRLATRTYSSGCPRRERTPSTKQRDGQLRPHPPMPRMPITLGSDPSGIVEEVGSEVTNFTVGQEVFAR